MNESDFKKLLKKDKYQVFLCKTPANTLLRFIIHTYFITNDKGKIKRWEILYLKSLCKTSWSHLHLNYLKPWQGFVKSFFSRNGPRFSGQIMSKVEERSAIKIIKFIEKSPQIYKFNNYYLAYPGPNSNTFTQWILDHFPESGLKLPWNAFGKNYSPMA